MTSNQEIGWFTNPLVPKNKNFKDVNRKTTHITKFADEYLTLTHTNPFKVKDR